MNEMTTELRGRPVLAESQLAELRKRLAVHVDAALIEKTTFIVPHTWPEIKNAEYEVLQRVALAARNIGCTMIVVDNDGYPLWSNRDLSLDKSKRVDPSTIDFMISFHFESPKLIDIFSYYAVWQPIDFYFHFGYTASVEKLLTHNECLSCRSDIADAHARNLFQSVRPVHSATYSPFFHSSPEPYLAPNIGNDARLFYVGVNWERLGGKKGRHHDLLLRLDKARMIDIYGPQKLLGAAPWEGFDCYRGELPFDGVSVVKSINKSGICLALSSAAHNRTGLMSNRLFEGLAAGAVIIADSNAFVARYFSDLVYVVDDTGTGEQLFSEISALVEGIRRDPDAAMERARKGQQRLKEAFSLEACLRALVAGHQDRINRYRAESCSTTSVTIIMTYLDDAIDTLLAMFRTAMAQSSVTSDVVLICDASFFARHDDTITEAARAVRQFSVITRDFLRFQRDEDTAPHPAAATGGATVEALASITTEYFCFLRSDEEWFRDHLATMARAMERVDGAVMGVSGFLVEEQSAMQRPSRRLGSLRFHFDHVKLMNGQYAEDFGRFLFSRRILSEIPMSCIALLDGQEPNLVRLAASLHGEPVQSGYATYIRKASESAMLPASVVIEEQQQQFIRDAFVTNPRWLDRVTRHSVMPEHIYAYSRSAPVRWQDATQPIGVARMLPLDRLVDTRADGSGVIYLQYGFSTPGPRFTWIEAEHGVLEFALPARFSGRQDWDLLLVMGSRLPAGAKRADHCTLAVNGVRLAYFEVPQKKSRITIHLPPATPSSPRRMRIHLIPDRQEDGSGGQRGPSVWIRRFGVMATERPKKPRGWWRRYLAPHKGAGQKVLKS